VDLEGSIRDRLSRLLDRIDRAAARAGRRREDVRLIAASKAQPVERLIEAHEAGVAAFGENYVQEAESKIAILPGVEWHLIGGLQRNKAGRAVVLFSWIDTIDSVRLLRDVARRAEEAGRVVPVLIEVNLAGEAGKAGIPPDGLPEILDAASGLPGVRVRGLLAIPPMADDPEESRPWFARLRELLQAHAGRGGPAVEPAELSMGMSHDLEVAIEEGATMVRIGTALFGSRMGRR
jgi:PLP dependent protein